MNHAQRLCRLINVLAGHEVDGLRNSEISDAMKVSRSTVTRDLQSLIEAGLVEVVPGMTDRWRLGPRVIQIALAHLTGIERCESRLSEVKQRYTRLPD